MQTRVTVGIFHEDHTVFQNFGYDSYKKWIAERPNRINIFYLFPWYMVLMIFNRMFFCTPKITDTEWTICPTQVLEAEYYKQFLSNAWFQNDNLMPVKQEFEKGRRMAMTILHTTGGIFRKIQESVADGKSYIPPLSMTSFLESYDFPFTNLSDFYFAQSDRQTVFQHTLKSYSSNPTFSPSLLLNHCILTPTFGVVRDEVPIHQDLASKLVEKYSAINVTIDDPNLVPSRSINRPSCNLSSIKQSFDNAKSTVAEIEERKKRLSEILSKTIPSPDRCLYDDTIRDFSNCYLVDLESLVSSNALETLEFTKILRNTTLNTLTPMFSNLWKIDKHFNIRMTDMVDLITYNANLISKLSPIRLTDIGLTDDLVWYSNLSSLFTLQMQSNMALFYSKIISNLDAKMKNQRGIPTPIPFPSLEPKSAL